MAGIYVYRSEDSCYLAMSMHDDQTFHATLGLMQSTPLYIMSSTIRCGLSTKRLQELEKELAPVLEFANNNVRRRIGDHKRFPRHPSPSIREKEACIEEVFNKF